MAHYTLLHRPTVSLSASFPNVVPLPLSQGKITGGRGVKSEVWWAVLTGCTVRAQSSSGRSRVWGIKGGSMSFPVAPTCVNSARACHSVSEEKSCICGYYEGQTFASWTEAYRALTVISYAGSRARGDEISRCTDMYRSISKEEMRLWQLLQPPKPPEPVPCEALAPRVPACELLSCMPCGSCMQVAGMP